MPCYAFLYSSVCRLAGTRRVSWSCQGQVQGQGQPSGQGTDDNTPHYVVVLVQ